MVDWARVFDGQWNSPIEAVHWLPIRCDTPNVVEDLRKPSLTFSGGALVVFRTGSRRFYTWSQARDRCLEVSDAGDWAQYIDNLDRIAASPEDPWSALCGANIEAVELFADRSDEMKRVVGARHRICQAEAPTYFWIAASFGEVIERDGDDLWVSIGVEPQNLNDLVLVQTLLPPTPPRQSLGGA